MELFKENLKEQDEVYCIFNHSIEGMITKKTKFHGMYLFSVKVTDEKNFKKWFGLNSANVKFLHCHLRKLYKTEVRQNVKRSKKDRRKAEKRV